jgi:septum formation protein
MRARYHRRVRLLLASASPRRAELLAAAGYAFTVMAAEVDETPLPDEPPVQYVRRLAEAKAFAAPAADSRDFVLAADTTVAVDHHLLGKPEDEADARRMLVHLAGREHTVHTGVAVRREGRLLSEVATTRVRFLPLEDVEIAWYVASGEPFGKAGAYAIQGRAARFIDWIEGSHSNVVGLPVHVVHRLLARAGWALDGPAGVR